MKGLLLSSNFREERGRTKIFFQKMNTRKTFLFPFVLFATSAKAFVLGPQDSSWVAEKSSPLVDESANPWTWEPLAGTDAVCLDGSQYGVVSCVSPSGPMKTAYIEIQG